jgi:hypothetical protein
MMLRMTSRKNGAREGLPKIDPMISYFILSEFGLDFFA